MFTWKFEKSITWFFQKESRNWFFKLSTWKSSRIRHHMLWSYYKSIGLLPLLTILKCACIEILCTRISKWWAVYNKTTASWAPFIFSKIDISTEWLGTLKMFFESLSSLTYNRLNKAIRSFAPFRLFFVYPAKIYGCRSSKLESGAILGKPTSPRENNKPLNWNSSFGNFK